MRVQVAAVGLNKVVAALQAPGDAASDARPAFHAIADDFLDVNRRRFRGAAGWAPNRRSTLARKQRKGQGVRPLVMTGGLERSLTVRGARYSVRKVTRTGATLGTKNPVANLHQRRHGNQPARPVLGLTEGDRRQWRGILADHLTGRLRGRGL